MEDLRRKEILLGTYEAFVLGYKLSEDGKSLVTSFADHAHSGSVRSVAAADKFMITSGEDENVKIFNLRRRSEHGSLTHADSTLNSLKFFEKKFLFTGSESGKISILKSGTWRVEKTLNKHQGGIVDISIHPSGKLALSIAKDKKLITWNLIKGRSAYVTNIKEIATVVEWSPSGEHYLVGYFRRAEVYSLSTAKIVLTIELSGRCNGVLFLDDVTLAVSGEMPHIDIYCLMSSKKIFSFDAHETRVRNMQLISRTSDSPEKLLVTSSTDGLIKVWSLDTTSGQFKASMLTQVDTKCRITCMIVHEVPLVEHSSIIEDKVINEAKPSSPKKNLKRAGFVVSTIPDTSVPSKKLPRKEKQVVSEVLDTEVRSKKSKRKQAKKDFEASDTKIQLKKVKKKKAKVAADEKSPGQKNVISIKKSKKENQRSPKPKFVIAAPSRK